MTRILERRTLVFALGVLILVLAMTSTAWAAGRNSVDSRAIKNGAVKTADLAKGAVTSAKVRDGKLTGVDLADSSVGSADLADGGVTGTHIANGSVEGADLANGSVDGTDLADESVGSADLTNGSVTSADIADGDVSDDDLAEFSVGAQELGWIDSFFATTGNIGDADGSTNGGAVGTASATANCPAGTQPISGGAEWVNPSSVSVVDKNLYIHTSRRSGNGWFVRGIVDFGAQGTVQLRVQVDCLMQGVPAL